MKELSEHLQAGGNIWVRLSNSGCTPLDGNFDRGNWKSTPLNIYSLYIYIQRIFGLGTQVFGETNLLLQKHGHFIHGFHPALPGTDGVHS